MARYRKIDTRLWAEARFHRLSRPKPNAQSLYFYLLAGPPTTAAPGLLAAGEAALSEALGWSVAAFRKAFRELEDAGLARADWHARVVFVPDAVAFNPPENPNAVRAWRKALDETPECPLREEAEHALRAAAGRFADVFDLPLREDDRGRVRVGPPRPDASASSSNGSRNDSRNGSPIDSATQEQEQEQEQESPPKPPSGEGGSPTRSRRTRLRGTRGKRGPIVPGDDSGVPPEIRDRWALGREAEPEVEP